MIILNQCRIDPEGKCLIIEATVETLSYYNNVYIESVKIDTDKTYAESGPSSNPIYTKEYESDYLQVDTLDDCSPLKTDEECKCGNVYAAEKAGVKHISLILSAKDLGLPNLNENIFFVYVIATGAPAPCTPCGMDNAYVRGVTFNMRPIYNMAMKFIKEINYNCVIPKGFIDMILRMKAFDLALRTGNFATAFRIWGKLFKNKTTVTPSKGCGCNGNN